jgi:nucleotide-binding universal stress UspA family protein
LVLGSTAGYLERHARCSLLVLPRAAIRSLPQVIDR